MKNNLSKSQLIYLIDKLLEENTECCLNCSNCIVINSLFVRCEEDIFKKESMIELLERSTNYGTKCKKYKKSKE